MAARFPATTVAILGVGLIGGSIGLALRARRPDWRILGVGRNPANLDEARRLGVIDKGTTDLSEGMAQADVAVVCTPVDRVAADVLAAAEAGPSGLLVTDAGSTKAGIVRAVEASSRGRSTFVGAHPIAGSERKGASHARADLFEGRVCVLTPTERTPSDRLERAREFWALTGSRLIQMDPSTHDEALAYTSHLPHAVAAALASAIPRELLPLAAGAYRDATRVAGSDAELWTSIFLENRQYVVDALDAFEGRLASFRKALEAAEPEPLREFWELARLNRLQFEADPTGLVDSKS